MLGVAEQHALGVGVRVDETRGNGQAGRVDPALGLAAKRSSIAAMSPSAMPMSARRAGAPVPSTTEPPLMMTSNMDAMMRDSTGRPKAAAAAGARSEGTWVRVPNGCRAVDRRGAPPGRESSQKGGGEAGFEPAMGCPIPHFQCGALGH